MNAQRRLLKTAIRWRPRQPAQRDSTGSVGRCLLMAARVAPAGLAEDANGAARRGELAGGGRLRERGTNEGRADGARPSTGTPMCTVLFALLLAVAPRGGP